MAEVDHLVAPRGLTLGREAGALGPERFELTLEPTLLVRPVRDIEPDPHLGGAPTQAVHVGDDLNFLVAQPTGKGARRHRMGHHGKSKIVHVGQSTASTATTSGPLVPPCAVPTRADRDRRADSSTWFPRAASLWRTT